MPDPAMHVKARMRCVENSESYNGTRKITLSAVYSSEPSDPNFTYSQATPSATFTMQVTNPAAYGQFDVGATYDVDFTQAPVAARSA